MHFKKFIISGYRGIGDTTEVSVENENLIPIIGKNESGKTTFLEAIIAFDYTNDTLNGGKHLINVGNLYSTDDHPIIISADVDGLNKEVLDRIFKSYFDAIEKEFAKKYPNRQFDIDSVDLAADKFGNVESISVYKSIQNLIKNSTPLRIQRNLRLKQYSISELKEGVPDALLHSIGELLVAELPYILYFDDFKERIPERIAITNDKTSALYSSWIPHIDELFRKTKASYSVYELPSKHDSTRRSIIREVTVFFNKVLAEEWSKYQFEQHGSINIEISYEDRPDGKFLVFKVVEEVEIDGEPARRYFDISDRSKGFYWYFNFMVKLHFNPSKRNSHDNDTIYLLDEPGSYLHSFALDKLAEQLKRLSTENKVIYCTHFHNLLNPKFIPINSIRVAEKINKGKILLSRIGEFSGSSKNGAYQPIFEALEIKPPLLATELDSIVLLEGIYDYYSFSMFTSDFFKYFPCASASTILNQIPFMVFLGKKYLALWDNDEEGQGRLQKASEIFGEVEAKKFMLLSTIGDNKKTRLEEYFEKEEIEVFKKVILSSENISLQKVILKLYYMEDRESVISKHFVKTKSNFISMEASLKERFSTNYSE